MSQLRRDSVTTLQARHIYIRQLPFEDLTEDLIGPEAAPLHAAHLAHAALSAPGRLAATPGKGDAVPVVAQPC